MEDTTKELLTNAGIDVSDVCERFMHKDELVFRFLKKFLKDENMTQLCQAISNGDIEQAFRAAHTLKGVCSNLGMQRILTDLVPLVEQLRIGDSSQANYVLPKIQTNYQEVIKAISEIP